MKFVPFFLFSSLFCFQNLFSQTIPNTDFNNYQIIKSEGNIPPDFTISAYNKVLDDIQNDKVDLKEKHEKNFLVDVHFGVNNLLHSGSVFYGDKVSEYLSEIGDKLLFDNKELRGKLKFYLIKSNECNAFSTFQGIIFVTSGLLAKLENESQLAFILAHEIIHFKEKHLIESFDFQLLNKWKSNKLKALNNFSRENELEADKLGLKLYYKAGYSKAELVKVFDVLKLSEFPFADFIFNEDVINTELLFVPKHCFTKRDFPIKIDENFNDSGSTHPNIKKRKESISLEITKNDKWGEQVFLISDKKFFQIRQICRFENVRLFTMSALYTKALYDIFSLEKEFPNSIFLKKMKAKSWLGLIQHANNEFSETEFLNEYYLQGEISKFQIFIQNLSRSQLNVIGLRIIEDLRIENPDDNFIKEIHNAVIRSIAENNEIDIKDFYDYSYQDLLNKQKNVDKIFSDTMEDNQFDTLNFHLYAIKDLLKSDIFLTNYSNFKAQKAKETEMLMAFNKLSKRKKKRKIINAKKIEIDTLILVDPHVLSFKEKEINLKKSDKLSKEFNDAVSEISESFKIKTINLTKNELKEGGTNLFNQKTLLLNYLDELLENKNIDFIPTDLIELEELKNVLGSNKVMYSQLVHNYNMEPHPIVILFSPLFYPIAMATVPRWVLLSNTSEFSYTVIDFSNGVTLVNNSSTNNDPINKYYISNRLFSFFSKIKDQSK